MSRTEGVVETVSVSGSEEWVASWVLACGEGEGEGEGEGVWGGVAGLRVGWRERIFGVVMLLEF